MATADEVLFLFASVFYNVCKFV